MLKFCVGMYNITNYEELTPHELSVIVEGRQDKERQDVETLKYTIAVAMGCALSGKDRPVFKKGAGARKVDKKQIEQERDYLLDTFKKGGIDFGGGR